jgi:hypothetical protein
MASLAGERKPHLLRSSPHNEPQSALSPDGQWLAHSSDESGRLEIYIERFGIGAVEAGHRWQVSSNGGDFPRWRRDGRELFYASADGELMSVMIEPERDSLKLAAPQALFLLPTVYYTQYSYDVAPDGQRFLVVAPPRARAREPLSVIVNWPSALAGGALSR